MSPKRKFTVFWCGRNDLFDRLRTSTLQLEDVHLVFTSSANFLTGRALFTPPDVVLIDGRADGIVLRSALHDFVTEFPATPIVAVTDNADHEALVDMMRHGISSYFVIPDEHRKLNEHLRLLHNEWLSKISRTKYLELQKDEYRFDEIIGTSSALKLTLERARKVIQNNARIVLITGETGTGKELIARAIHYNSKNKMSPFVEIACTALPETLLESELFGYEKGAFTDARERKIGLFELAGEGSIFLDEIGDMSLATQSKLLKAIEGRSMRRVGGTRDIQIRARIIAATSANLEAKMKSGEFRRDLFHRLKILPLELPPLRERKEDIPLLSNGFLKKFNALYEKQIKGLTDGAMQVLMDHDWEGNVRELKHSIERAVLLEEGDWLSEKDFELSITLDEHSNGRMVLSNLTPPGQKDDDTLMLMLPLSRASLGEVQSILVEKVLERVGGNKVKAARILKISRPRLDRILKAESGED